MKNTKIKTTKDTENITNISTAIKNAVDYLITCSHLHRLDTGRRS